MPFEAVGGELRGLAVLADDALHVVGDVFGNLVSTSRLARTLAPRSVVRCWKTSSAIDRQLHRGWTARPSCGGIAKERRPSVIKGLRQESSIEILVAALAGRFGREQASVASGAVQGDAVTDGLMFRA
jgi:hypothetical protein